jgi:hypothetical protein
MDLYYQQYKSNADFFDLLDFDYFVGVGHADILQMEYDKSYALLRQDHAQDIVQFDDAWLTKVVLKVKKDEEGYYSDLPGEVMSFMTDRQTVGIQNVFALEGGRRREINRGSINTTWQDKYLPKGCGGFWHLEPSIRIRFVEDSPPKVMVIYIPSSDDPNLIIPGTKEAQIIQYVLNLMFAAKDKRVVKKINDRNPNAVLQAESDLPVQ